MKTLEEIRLENGLSIEQIIREANISRPTWKKLAAGEKDVSTLSINRTISAINRILGTSYTRSDFGYSEE